jgi:type III restriction enzyme
MELLIDDQGWTVERLANWLDRQIPHPDVTLSQGTLFLYRLVTKLIEERGFSLEQLVHDKFRLRDAAAAKIQGHRLTARTRAYQQLLAGPVEVDAGFTFTYPMAYPANWYYEGKYRFQKHYYPLVGELKSEGEEFACAQFIDMLPKVRYWVRNLERRPLESFWLQTATDRFYPDFVALLEDGRLLVVEYKGSHLWDSPDSKEKRALGALWQDRGASKVVFCMVNDRNMTEILTTIAG